MTANDRKEWLIKHGYIVGQRDPHRNTAFKGAFMVAELYQPGYNCIHIPETTDSASDGVFCIVGDSLPILINDAFNHLYADDI